MNTLASTREEYLAAGRQYQEAQATLENEIKRRNDAERQYNEAYARQRELEGN